MTRQGCARSVKNARIFFGQSGAVFLSPPLYFGGDAKKLLQKAVLFQKIVVTL